jgi:hypothetical protein
MAGERSWRSRAIDIGLSAALAAALVLFFGGSGASAPSAPAAAGEAPIASLYATRGGAPGAAAGAAAPKTVFPTSVSGASASSSKKAAGGGEPDGFSPHAPNAARNAVWSATFGVELRDGEGPMCKPDSRPNN